MSRTLKQNNLFQVLDSEQSKYENYYVYFLYIDG